VVAFNFRLIKYFLTFLYWFNIIFALIQINEMSKKVVSIFLSVGFLLFIIAPTIIVMVDDTIDVSIVFSTSEEEEKGNEKHLDIEVLFSKVKTNESDLVYITTDNNLGYYYKKYPKPHLNLISPPPDYNNI